MSFDRTRDDLKALENRVGQGGEITAEDIFNTIRDLCEDIRCDTGSPVEQKATGSPAQLLRQLPWLGRLVTRQYGRISSHVVDLGRKEELSHKMDELDRLCEEMELLSGQTEVLAQKELQLRKTLDGLQKKEAEKEQLRKECDSLEQQLRQLTQEDMQALRSRRDSLQSDLSAATATCQQSRVALDALEKKTNLLREENQQTAARIESRVQMLDEAVREQETLSEKLKNTEEALRKAEDQTQAVRAAWELCSQTQLPEAKKSLEEQRLRRDQAMQELDCLQTERKELEEQEKALQQEATALRQALLDAHANREKLTRDSTQKQQELERLRQILKDLDNDCAQLQQQLDQLMGDLAGKDAQQVKENLTEAIRQKEQALKEFRELEIRVQDEEALAREQAQKNEAAVAQEQELKRRTEQENQKAQDRIATLQQQISALQQQRQQHMSQENQLKAQVEQLQSWLKSLSLEQYTQRLERLRQRCQLLARARTALEEDLQRLAQLRGIPEGELDSSLFDGKLQEMEQWLRYYQELFGQTVRLLSSGEKSQK